MTSRKLNIVDGPDKPALQWSLTKPGHANEVNFRLDDDALSAQIQRMEEQVDGFTFKLSGHITSGALEGRPFQAVYSIESRSGWMRIDTERGAPHGQV